MMICRDCGTPVVYGVQSDPCPLTGLPHQLGSSAPGYWVSGQQQTDYSWWSFVWFLILGVGGLVALFYLTGLSIHHSMR